MNVKENILNVSEKSKKPKLALVNIIENKNIYPLNLVCLATYLKEKMEIDIRIIDINYEDPFEAIIAFNPDIVGISSLTVTYPYAISLAKKIKNKLDIPLLLGGAHPTTMPTSIDKIFNVVVIGEGEETLEQLLMLYSSKNFTSEDLKKIKGIVFYQDNELILTEKREFIMPLDKLPIPDLSFVNKEYFRKKDQHVFKGKVGIIANIMTSRGCPYNCVFCASPVIWQRKVRFFSVKRVVDEIEYLVNTYKVNMIQVYDDVFSIGKSRLYEIIDGLEERNLLNKIVIACQSRANIMDEELCEIFKTLNVLTVSFGFESGNEKILKYLKKESVTIEQNKNAAILTKKHGFNLYGSFIIANPGEKMEQIEETIDFIDFLKDIGADGIDVYIASPLPGTEFWQYGVQQGRIPKEFDLDKIPNFYSPSNSFLKDESLSQEQIEKVYSRVLEKLSFFSQRRSILHILLYPKEPILKTLKRAILNPKATVIRVITRLV